MSSGIVGAVVLGLGRALGETMAIAMVSGAELGALPSNIYSTMTTIAATVVSQLDSALTDSTNFAVKTLAEVSLVLMLITLLTNMAARALVRRASSTALPVGTRCLTCGRSRLGAGSSTRCSGRAACAALAVVIGPTLWMLIGVVGRAWPVFHFSVLVQDTQGNGGGLRNAIVGTVVLGLGVTLVAGTVSVLAGIYLSEFATGRTRSILRGAYEVLSGIPSIVLGYVGYIALVVDFDWGFSLAAGVVVLSVMSIPYITKATESALSSGADVVPGRGRGTWAAVRLDPAQDRAEAGDARDRHRHAGGARAGDQRDGADAVHGGLVGFAADRTTHRIAGRLPDLSDLDVLQPAVEVGPGLVL